MQSDDDNFLGKNERLSQSGDKCNKKKKRKLKLNDNHND
jgi:hypothetical protein